MTTAKQARHSHFQRGQGAFKCNNCGRSTRDTGDNGQCHLCPECFELAGYENVLMDGGSADNGALNESDRRTVRAYLAELASHIGDRAYELHHELVAAVELPAEAPVTETPVTETQEPTMYLVHVTGFSHDELVLVEAPAARFARRIAKQQYRDAAHSLEGLTFSAHRAI